MKTLNKYRWIGSQYYLLDLNLVWAEKLMVSLTECIFNVTYMQKMSLPNSPMSGVRSGSTQLQGAALRSVLAQGKITTAQTDAQQTLMAANIYSVNLLTHSQIFCYQIFHGVLPSHQPSLQPNPFRGSEGGRAGAEYSLIASYHRIKLG